MAVQPDPQKLAYARSLYRKTGASLRDLEKLGAGNRSSIGKWLSGEAKPRDPEGVDKVITALQALAKKSSDINLRVVGVRQVYVYPPMVKGAPEGMREAETIEIKDTGGDRAIWGRRIHDRALAGLLEPGDVALFRSVDSIEDVDPGQVVQIVKDGTDFVRIARGGGNLRRFVSLSEDYEPIPSQGVQVKGVAIMRIRRGRHDTTITTEYPHGMSDTDRDE